MIRMTILPRGDSVTLCLEGHLTEGTITQIDTAFPANGTRSLIDLSGLQFVDNSGAEFLRRLVADGAEVVSCHGFVKEMLAEGKADREGAEHDEAEFVARLKAGDEAAFEELVHGFGGRMLSVARRYLGNENDACDAVQEAFAAAFESIHRFKGGSLLSTWLHRIVVNAALMQLRRRRRKPEQSIEELLPHFDLEGAWAEDDRSNLTSLEILDERERRRMVLKCIARLPERYRVVLMLRDIEELDTAETAHRLGLAANTVKVRLHRGRQALRTLLVRELSGERMAAREVSVGA
jgi:RNA polymerase sigma-70 factor (ECF subfamily)